MVTTGEEWIRFIFIVKELKWFYLYFSHLQYSEIKQQQYSFSYKNQYNFAKA